MYYVLCTTAEIVFSFGQSCITFLQDVPKHLSLGFCRGDFGRLGHGNSSDVFIPQPIKALHGMRIKQIACGDSHCLAVSMEGEVQRFVICCTICIENHISC